MIWKPELYANSFPQHCDIGFLEEYNSLLGHSLLKFNASVIS